MWVQKVVIEWMTLARLIQWSFVFFLVGAGERTFADSTLPSEGSKKIFLAESDSVQRSLARVQKKRKVRKLAIPKKRAIVPKAKTTIQKIKRRTMRIAEPPKKFKRYFEEGTDEAELESVINEEIKQLFDLLKTSNRRDLRLRLGSLYVEKSRLIEYRLYETYDQQMKLFEEGTRTSKPKLNLKSVYDYVTRAIRLFETYRQQYAKDKNLDRVLFFLGVGYFKRGELKKGRDRYQELLRRFPKSEYVKDTNFELGEYYFNQSSWKKATAYYRKITSNRKLRLYPVAMYKLAWCRFKMNQVGRAILNLETVIRLGYQQKMNAKTGIKEASRLHFAEEAMRDLALFYSYSKRNPALALSYFQTLSASAPRALRMLKTLAYNYLDIGNLRGIRITFKQLIRENPSSPLAYQYQYQIIRAYTYSGRRSIFLKELRDWLVRYGPSSVWAEEQGDNQELIRKVTRLMENTVRNYALRMHQSFRKTKSPLSKSQALLGYEMYIKNFKNFLLSDQMYFFYAELLFDLKRYQEASAQYWFIVKNFRKSKYYNLASLNSVLAFEKNLPSSERIREIVGDNKKFVAFPSLVHRFQKIAYSYVENFPKEANVPAILYKMASLHYEFNHYDEALAQFWNLIRQYPSDLHAEYSANLILDIYNLKKDFKGLQEVATQLLKNTMIARSSSGQEMRKILSQVSLKSAESLAKNKQYFESAELYQSFAKKHPKSPLRIVAYYNAGVNFKKSGDLLKALSLYRLVLNDRSSKNRKLRVSILKEIPSLYQQIGQYKRAAEAFFDYAKFFPKDASSVDFLFNAALIYDGFNLYSRAEKAYLEYYKRSRKSEKVQALYLLAELMQRRGRSEQTIAYYNQFLNKGSRDGKALVKAAFMIAEIRKSQRKISASKSWYKRTINIYRKNQVGVFYAAQAKFELVYDIYLQFVKIKIPSQPKKQQQMVQKKLKVLEILKENLKQVIRFDSGEQIVASLVLIGLASQNMYTSIYRSTIPKSLNKEEAQKYKLGLKKAADPFLKEAVKNYESAIVRARKLSVYSSKWLKKAVGTLSKIQKTPINSNPLLREIVSPVTLYDWLGAE